MKPLLVGAATALCAFSAAAADVQTCAGFAPPYKNTCPFPITVWYKPAAGGAVKSINLAPGQGDPTDMTPQQKAAGVATAVCKQGETAYDWSGGAHGTTVWTGAGGYECRKN